MAKLQNIVAAAIIGLTSCTTTTETYQGKKADVQPKYEGLMINRIKKHRCGHNHALVIDRLRCEGYGRPLRYQTRKTDEKK